MIRLALAVLAAALPLAAQTPPVVTLAGVCADEEIRDYGLVCDEDEPCPITVEIAGLEIAGSRWFATANLLTGSSTLWGLLLMSEDGGKTWTEPAPRQRGVSLDMIQFATFEHGWVSGHSAGSLARDPFLMRTTDGGKTWRKTPLYRDTTVAFIEQFWFDSPDQGTMILQRRGTGAAGRYQRLETRDGGVTWSVRESGDDPIAGKRPRGAPPMPADWRVRADARSGALRIERQEAKQWRAAALFSLTAGKCAPRPVEPMPEPEPPPEPPG
jgi:hypothetical protein